METKIKIPPALERNLRGKKSVSQSKKTPKLTL